MYKRSVRDQKFSPDDEDKSNDEPYTSLDLESNRNSPNKHFEPDNEFRKEAMINDVKIFGILFQILICAGFFGLIVLNVFNINYYCQTMLEENGFRCKCNLAKCHYYLMSISLAIINVITSMLVTYDFFQAKKRGYRLHEYFLYFIGTFLYLNLLLKIYSYRLCFYFSKKKVGQAVGYRFCCFFCSLTIRKQI